MTAYFRTGGVRAVIGRRTALCVVIAQELHVYDTIEMVRSSGTRAFVTGIANVRNSRQRVVRRVRPASVRSNASGRWFIVTGCAVRERRRISQYRIAPLMAGCCGAGWTAAGYTGHVGAVTITVQATGRAINIYIRFMVQGHRRGRRTEGNRMF